MIRIVWTLEARRDLREIGAYISRDKPGAARRFVERLRTRARRAAEQPESGRRLPELNLPDVRELIEGNYRIVYRTARGSVLILTVFEGHRPFPMALFP